MLRVRIESQDRWQEQPSSGLLLRSEIDLQSSHIENLMVFRRDSGALEMLPGPGHVPSMHTAGSRAVRMMGTPKIPVFAVLGFAQEGSTWLYRPELPSSLFRIGRAANTAGAKA